MRNFKEEKNLNHYEFFVQKEGLTDNKTYGNKLMYWKVFFIIIIFNPKKTGSQLCLKPWLRLETQGSGDGSLRLHSGGRGRSSSQVRRGQQAGTQQDSRQARPGKVHRALSLSLSFFVSVSISVSLVDCQRRFMFALAKKLVPC